MSICAHHTVDALSGRCVYCQHRVDPSASLLAAPPPAEPTTAEAFATVRDFINEPSSEDPDDARRAIALLERRMREMPGQTFNMLWPVVKPWLKPGSADLVHDEMIKALPDV